MNQEKIGKFIQTLRKEKKLTQLQLAEKLGVTDRAVSKWENGKCMPDLSLFIPLAEEFDVSVNELLSGEKIKEENYHKKLEENWIQYEIQQKKKEKIFRTFCLVITTICVTILLSIFLFLLGHTLWTEYWYQEFPLKEEEYEIQVCRYQGRDYLEIKPKDGHYYHYYAENLTENRLKLVVYRTRRELKNKELLEQSNASVLIIDSHIQSIVADKQTLWRRSSEIKDCQIFD